MAKKIRRYVVVGTNKDGEIGAWDDKDRTSWTRPWAVYDTQLKQYFPYSVGWRWVATVLAIYLTVTR